MYTFLYNTHTHMNVFRDREESKCLRSFPQVR